MNDAGAWSSGDAGEQPAGGGAARRGHADHPGTGPEPAPEWTPAADDPLFGPLVPAPGHGTPTPPRDRGVPPGAGTPRFGSAPADPATSAAPPGASWGEPIEGADRGGTSPARRPGPRDASWNAGSAAAGRTTPSFGTTAPGFGTGPPSFGTRPLSPSTARPAAPSAIAAASAAAAANAAASHAARVEADAAAGPDARARHDQDVSYQFDRAARPGGPAGHDDPADTADAEQIDAYDDPYEDAHEDEYDDAYDDLDGDGRRRGGRFPRPVLLAAAAAAAVLVVVVGVLLRSGGAGTTAALPTPAPVPADFLDSAAKDHDPVTPDEYFRDPKVAVQGHSYTRLARQLDQGCPGLTGGLATALTGTRCRQLVRALYISDPEPSGRRVLAGLTVLVTDVKATATQAGAVATAHRGGVTPLPLPPNAVVGATIQGPNGNNEWRTAFEQGHYLFITQLAYSDGSLGAATDAPLVAANTDLKLLASQPLDDRMLLGRGPRTQAATTAPGAATSPAAGPPATTAAHPTAAHS